MSLAVKCEMELRQDLCSHVLKPIDPKDAARMFTSGERPYKYECVKCGRCLKNKNGVMC